MKAFSKGLKQYFKKRDTAINGLILCECKYTPLDLENAGYVNIESQYFDEDGDEYEFHIFKNSTDTVVVTQVYVDKEGGLYYQSMFTKDGKKP